MKYITVLVWVLLLGLVACASGIAAEPAAPSEPTATHTPAPARPTLAPAATSVPVDEEWKPVSPAQAGLDPDTISALQRALDTPAYEDVHSVLLVQDGKLVFEEYRGAYGPDSKQEVASVTKSVTSILVGIAMEQGFLDGLDQGGLDQPVAALLPEYEEQIRADAAKENLLFRHILSMSAGLEWDEESIPYGTPGNDCYETEVCRDSAGYVLGKPVTAAPGAVFQYNGGLSNLLSAIVQARTGQQMAEYADQVLFQPLGIRDYRWDNLRDGRADAAGGLHLRPRDMAKIGQLMLDGGQWHGTQIVSPEWVAESTRLQIHTGQGPDYGLQWWRGTLHVAGQPIETFFASGHGGQAIYVVPSLELVAVFTQEVFGNPLGTLRGAGMLTQYVLPAVLLPAMLPERVELDATALDRLVGEYRRESDGETLTVQQRGEQLYLQHADVGEVALKAESATRFSCVVMDVLPVQLTFDDSDPAEHLTVHIDFRTERYRRCR
jgi:CubicO group peptidase (beta-lactamase class C family)